MKSGNGKADRARTVGSLEFIGASVSLALLTLAFLPGALSSRHVFYFRDLFRVHFPAKSFWADSVLGNGELPLWSPFHAFGQPFLADPNYTVLYPSNLLYLLLPVARAFNLHIVIHIFIGALFTYLLCRRIRLPVPASLVGAIAFGFSGFQLSLGNFYNAVSAAAYLPFVLWLFVCACRESSDTIPVQRTVGLAIIGGLVIALQFLGGEPVYLLLTAGCLVLAWAAGAALGRMSKFRGLLFCLIAAPLAAVVSAAQLIPAIDLIGQTGRGAGFTLEQASQRSLHPLRLVELVCPEFFGDPHALSYWHFWGHHWFDGNFPYILSIYAGVGVLCLACLALTSRRGMMLPLLLWTGASFSIVLALGRYGELYPLLYRTLPGMEALRYPVKFLYPVYLCFALLAALGVERLMEGTDRSPSVDSGGGPPESSTAAGTATWWQPMERGGRLAAGLLISAVVSVLIWLAVLFTVPRIETWFAGGLLEGHLPRAVLEEAASGLVATVLRSLGLGACFLLLLAGLSFVRGRFKQVLIWSIPVVVAFDLLSALGGLNPVAPVDFYDRPMEGPLATILALEEENGSGEECRRFRLHHDSGKDLPSVTLNAPDDDRLWHFYWMRRHLFPMTAPVEYAFEPNWDEMYLRPAVRAAEIFHTVPARSRGRFLGLFNVRYVVSMRPSADPSLEEVGCWDGESNLSVRLLVNHSCLPRVYWVPRSISCADEEEALHRLRQMDFNERREVLIIGEQGKRGVQGVVETRVTEREREADPGMDGVESPARQETASFTMSDAVCRIVSSGNCRAEIEIQAPAEGYLVLADSWAEGWRVLVDGEPAALLQANLAFRAVSVQRGRHHVLFSYRPWWLGVAPAVSCLGLAVSFLILLLIRRKISGRG